jgi:hypothetical protein
VADRQAEKIMLGHGDTAEADLLAYLADAERQVLDAYRTGARPSVPRPSRVVG